MPPSEGLALIEGVARQKITPQWGAAPQCSKCPMEQLS